MVAYLRGARDFVDAFDKGKDREDAIKILIKYTNLKDRALYDKMVMTAMPSDGRVSEKVIEDEINWYLAHGYIKENINVKDIVDNQFVEYANGVLGKYE